MKAWAGVLTGAPTFAAFGLGGGSWNNTLMQLTGDLQKVSLPNLLQLIRNGALSGKIVLTRGVQQAVIFFENGTPVHAEQDLNMGRETLLELFLWDNGSFLFMEGESATTRRSIDPKNPAESMDAIMRDGIAYADQQELLNQVGVTGRSVLSPVESAIKQVGEIDAVSKAVLNTIDGKRTLNQIFTTINIPRRVALTCLNRLVQDHLIAVTQTIEKETVQVDLPDWIVARLKQEDPDLSKAIMDMVIWSDRLKIWLFQADAEFSRITEELDRVLEQSAQKT